MDEGRSWPTSRSAVCLKLKKFLIDPIDSGDLITAAAFTHHAKRTHAYFSVGVTDQSEKANR